MRAAIGLSSLILLLLVTQVAASELLTKARSDYDYQLDAYREAYDEFLLKRSQFNTNSSFANQEALVKTARDMLEIRAEVWWAYWQAMRIDVLESEGVETASQDALAAEIAAIQNRLRQHATLIKGIETREPLLTEAQNLNLVYEDYLAMAFRTLRALKLARFTSAIDTMQLFHRQLQEAVAVQIRNANERQVRERGLGEVESILSRLEEQLVLVETELDRTQVRRFDNAYEDIVEELSPLYPDLLRAYQLLEELSTGIVL